MNIQCPRCKGPEPMFSPKRQIYICEECGHEFARQKPIEPLRIFLSYGHDANEELVRCIKTDLERRGHDIWFDKTEIKAGDNWRRAITDGIVGSRRVISFLSKHSTRDPGVCRDEIAIAIGVKGGNIQTVLVESEAEVMPPVNIGHIQWLDMHDWKDWYAKGGKDWEEWYQGKFAEIVRVVESDESRRFAGEIETLDNHLKPIKSDARIHELLGKGFFGRSWLFEAVEQWRRNMNRSSRLFWIIGAPGVGKSAYAAQLAHTRSDVVIAAQFVQWDKPDHRDAARVIRSLAFQLATCLPYYRMFLLTLPEIADLDWKNPAELFDYLLANPLGLVIGGGGQRYVIVIDALDEANEGRLNPLVEMLARHASRLPDWLGIVVTSRPEAAVTSPLQGLNPHLLDTRTEANLDDLRNYLRHALAPQLAGRNDSEPIIEQIIEKSEGVFLYAEYVCASLAKGDLSLDHLDRFPQGLGGIYHQYFTRQFPDLDYYEEKITPLLQAVLAAFEPLETGFLKALCHIDEDTELWRRLNRLGSLFPVSGDGGAAAVRPFHRSLCDWITNRDAAGHYIIKVSDGHRALARFCLAEYGQGADRMSGYALRFLPAHLVAAQRWDDLIGDDATPGPLTDLLFIRAKCEAGLVHDLVRDYNEALAALPEFAEETDHNQRRDAAMFAYSKALSEYAVVRCDWWFAKERGETRPEPPYPLLPKELQDEAERSIPEESSASAARLRHFANFVNARLGLLASTPHDALPLAFNFAQEGPVSADAERRIAVRKEPWLRRSPRPPVPPFRPQCLRTLEGHSAEVTSVSVSPDRRRAVSGSRDNTVRVWDLETGACLRTLEGHSGSVDGVSVSPDGRRAISGSGDCTVRVWDLETGECLRTLEGHNAGVLSVSVSPDGRRAVSGSYDKTVRVWDLETGAYLRTLEGHSNEVKSVSVSPDGRHAVSGSHDKTVRVWDLTTGECLAVYHAGTAVSAAIFTPDGNRMVCSTYDGQIHLLTPVNFPPSGPPIITAAFLWLFGDNAAPGHWDEHLTALCPWCNRRFPVGKDILGRQIACPLDACGKPLQLNPFVMDGRLSGG